MHAFCLNFSGFIAEKLFFISNENCSRDQRIKKGIRKQLKSYVAKEVTCNPDYVNVVVHFLPIVELYCWLKESVCSWLVNEKFCSIEIFVKGFGVTLKTFWATPIYSTTMLYYFAFGNKYVTYVCIYQPCDIYTLCFIQYV